MSCFSPLLSPQRSGQRWRTFVTLYEVPFPRVFSEAEYERLNHPRTPFMQNVAREEVALRK